MSHISLAVILFSSVICTTLSQSRVRVHKCCPLHQVIDISKMKCKVSGRTTWTPWFYKEETNEEYAEDVDYDIVTYKPKCPQTNNGVHLLPLRELPLQGIPAARFKLLKNGRLHGQHVSGRWISIPENACIDGIMNYAGSGPVAFYTGEETDQAIITCPISPNET